VLKAEIGYERSAALVETASASGRTLVEVLVESNVMTRESVLELLKKGSEHPDPDTLHRATDSRNGAGVTAD
jgi:aspartate ammonia-lyase